MLESAGSQDSDSRPCKALPWAPRLCELLDVMEVKKPGISRCFAATQLCTPFDQHLSRILAANFPKMNCKVLLADDNRIPGQCREWWISYLGHET